MCVLHTSLYPLVLRMTEFCFLPTSTAKRNPKMRKRSFIFFFACGEKKCGTKGRRCGEPHIDSSTWCGILATKVRQRTAARPMIRTPEYNPAAAFETNEEYN